MDIRTKVCIWIIVVGMANFLAYTVVYLGVIGGESVRGQVVKTEVPGGVKVRYFLDSGKEVPRGDFIYLGIHSISIWLTVGAVMLAMLTLAKDRISDSMHQAMMRGRSLCTVLAVVIGICTAGMAFHFMRKFVSHFEHPEIARTSPATQQTSPIEMPD
jgi:hypothetical protein